MRHEELTHTDLRDTLHAICIGDGIQTIFLSINYCRQAMDVLMRITGVTAEQFLVWIVNYHPSNIERNVLPPQYTLYMLRGQYQICLYTPRQLFGEGKYLFNKKKILIPVSLVESELTAYKNCVCVADKSSISKKNRIGRMHITLYPVENPLMHLWHVIREMFYSRDILDVLIGGIIHNH